MRDEQLCDGSGRDPVSGRLIDTRPRHGCWKCCPTCNVDRHECPGCGASLRHGVEVCLRCRNTL